ncbi:Mitogen-activated protein kinase kinase 9 [Dichanthelium oligosanthes]|uniref:Mitogen-activated protein kinase kinase 9 n=1 Tax=Dichanthelium oligosanthes TaxID=888268 RepID=A0A1E5WLQ9_9POAL|nr:Mitogen-activated protein kinase kinase 9 [Dichanthelium oligosanthes]
MACSVAPAAPHQMFHRVIAAPHQMMRAPSPVAAPAPEEMQLSDLDWIGHLGAGGFACVSKARHRRTGAVFALKMSFDDGPDMEEEAKVLSRAAGSPHVIDCHAMLRAPGGEPAFLLEFMDAGSLGRVMRQRRGKGIPEAALAEVAAQCVVGLAQLHSRGVAHLDVKPDNFLANSRAEIKISDFNTSRILYGGAGEHLQVRIACGTSSYFSPERFAPNAHAGPHGAMAADVWGLGITVLELFLGRFAVLADAEKTTVEDLKQAICHVGPPRVPDEAEASAELRGFVAACLQKEPTRRATVPQLLGHPFVTRRDVEASRRALRELIVETM